MCTRRQEKGAVSPQETELDLPVTVKESPVEAWINSLASGQQQDLASRLRTSGNLTLEASGI